MMQKTEITAGLKRITDAIAYKLPDSYHYGDDVIGNKEVMLHDAFLPLFVLSANQYSVIMQGKRLLPFIAVKSDEGLCGMSLRYDDSTEEDASTGGSGFIGFEEMPLTSLWSLASFYLSASMRQVLIDENNPDMPVDLSVAASNIIEMVEPLPDGHRIPEQDMKGVTIGIIKECLEGFERAQRYQAYKKAAAKK